MSKMQEIEGRRAELIGDEAAVAERIVYWFDILAKLRQAAGVGVPPRELVEQIMRIDPDMLYNDNVDAINFLYQRFEAEHGKLAKRKQAIDAAASKVCPYTAAEYDAAVAEVGTAPKRLAPKLKVSRNTLAKYGRPPD